MNKSLLESMLPIKDAAKAYPRAKQPRGSFLIETTISLFVLVAIAIVLLDASFNILKPRTWTMKTNLVDAYLSQEVALMNSIDFDDIINPEIDVNDDPTGWGSGSVSVASLANAVPVTVDGTPGGSTDIVMGKLPGFSSGGAGRDYTARVYRLRIIPIVNAATIVNSTTAADFEPGAEGDPLTLADTGVNCYELQTHVVYTVGNDTFVKTRSVIRSQ